MRESQSARGSKGAAQSNTLRNTRGETQLREDEICQERFKEERGLRYPEIALAGSEVGPQAGGGRRHGPSGRGNACGEPAGTEETQ